MDSRETIIERWIDIAETVFDAGYRIRDEWMPKLMVIDSLPVDKRKVMMDEYLRAIATEIVKWGEGNEG